MTPHSAADGTRPTPADVPQELADRLYGLPLDEFVTARDGAARAARADGDRGLARRIAALPKPTVAAWVVDQTVRTLPHAVAAVVSVGDELRDATAQRDRDRLVALDRERRRLLDALLDGVADTVRPGGRPASEATLRAVRDTFVAAVADPGAAAAVRAGHLARGLEHVGFGVVDEAGEPVELPPAPPKQAGRTTERRSPRSDDEATAQAAAERAADDAAGSLDAAEEALDAARAVHEERQVALTAATDAVDRAEARIADLESELRRRREERDAAAVAADEAREAAEVTARDLVHREGEAVAAEQAATEARRRLRAARRTVRR